MMIYTTEEEPVGTRSYKESLIGTGEGPGI